MAVEGGGDYRQRLIQRLFQNKKKKAGAGPSSKTFSSPPKDGKASLNRFAMGEVTGKDDKYTTAAIKTLASFTPNPEVIAEGVMDPEGTAKGLLEWASIGSPAANIYRGYKAATGGGMSVTGADESDINQFLEIAGIIPYNRAAKAGQFSVKYAPKAATGLKYAGAEALAQTQRMGVMSGIGVDDPMAVYKKFMEGFDANPQIRAAAKAAFEKGKYKLVGGKFGGEQDFMGRAAGLEVTSPEYANTGVFQDLSRALSVPTLVKPGDIITDAEKGLNDIAKHTTNTLASGPKRLVEAAAKDLFGTYKPSDTHIKLLSRLLDFKPGELTRPVRPDEVKDLVRSTIEDAPGLARGTALLTKTAQEQFTRGLQHAEDPEQFVVDFLANIMQQRRIPNTFRNTGFQADHFGILGSPSTSGQYAADVVRKMLPKELFADGTLVPGLLRSWIENGGTLGDEITAGIKEVSKAQNVVENVSGVSQPVNLNWGALPRTLEYLGIPEVTRVLGEDSLRMLDVFSAYTRDRIPFHTGYWEDVFEKGSDVARGFEAFAKKPDVIEAARKRLIGRQQGKH